jgi:diacylglycerol kinase
MKKIRKFSFSGRIKSFFFAFSGWKYLYKYEHNFRVHLLTAAVVIVSGIFLELSFTEWSLIFLVISLVFITEIINSSLEYLADYISPEYSETIKRVKDFAAAGVLTAALSSIIVGILIFLPKLLF